MKISQLTEVVSLLQTSKKDNKTTIERFEQSYDARASIKSVGDNIFEIILLHPPTKLKDIPISAMKWHNSIYVFISDLVNCDQKFMKGKVKLWRSKSMIQPS